MDKERIKKLCEQSNITIYELEKILGMSNGSLRKDGDIKSERLRMIADYFNVSMDYLMGIDHPTDFVVFDNEKEFLIEYRKADDDTKKMISEMISFFINQSKKDK